MSEERKPRLRVVRPPQYICYVCEKQVAELYALDQEKESDEFSDRTVSARSRVNEKVVTLLQQGKKIYRHDRCELGSVNYTKFEERRELENGKC